MGKQHDMAQLNDSRSLAETLRHAIMEGQYSQFSPLPSCRQLSATHGVGMRVARNALSRLEAEGLIYSRERRGTFVRWGSPKANAQTVGLRCVNIVERAEGTVPLFNRTAYLRSYTEVLEQHDLKMRLVSAPAREEECNALFSSRFALRQQGCVLVNVLDPMFLRWLQQQGAPHVVQHFKQYHADNLPEHHSVIVNKTAGGFEATRHLLGLGHRRIGFMGSVPDPSSNTPLPLLNVYDGYVAALQCAAFLPRPADLMSPGTNTESVALEMARRYLDRPDLPTAVVTQTDILAASLLRVARDRGIAVPEQLSVIGVDGLDESAETDPPLTVVAVPRRILGREALQLLLDVVDGKVEGFQHRALDCRLVIRKSTGPAHGTR